MEYQQRHLALLTEYDGSAFNGWQSQAIGRTVQQTLQKAIMELTGEKNLQLTGSSRTDSGVHARGHVSHFQTACGIPTAKFALALNSRLPDDVAVLAACEVESDFHARYHALSKIYTYRIWNHPCRPAIDRLRVAHVPCPLDHDLMLKAMPLLVGQHNFQAFCDTGSCVRNPVRTLQNLQLDVRGPLLTITVQGDGFLYHMVRILAGTLVAVAQGKIELDALPAIIAAGDRTLNGKTMPAQGLCLERVFYEPSLFDDYFSQMAKAGELIEQPEME